MKAAVIYQYGPPDILRVEEVAKPAIKPDQILIQVHASSVNPIDWKIRKGMLKLLTGHQFPMILGFDVSGEVIEVGDRVNQFKPGTQVFSRLDSATGGAYAEYAVASENAIYFKPENLSHQEAAAIPLAAMTALQALRDQGQLQQGQRVLINGASGGVGTFAIQIAKVIGAEVTGVCSSRNIELVKSLGCDRVIDYTQQNFLQEAYNYDVVFDAVGKYSFNACKSVLTSKGIYVTTQPLPQHYLASLLTWFTPQKAKVVLVKTKSQDLAYLKDLTETGKFRPVIDRTYPLDDIAAAHVYSQEGHVVGKVVIAIAN